MKFKAIGFDYGGVIAGESGVSFANEVCRILGVEVDEFKEVYFRYNQLPNAGKMPWEGFWSKVAQDLNRADKKEDLIKLFHSQSSIEVNKPMLELVRDLRTQYKVGLLTNCSVERAVEMRKQGLDKEFDAFIISAEIGFSKPDKRAFEIFLKELGVVGEELLFIDDTKQSLTTAEEIGFTPVLFQGYVPLKEQLSSMGVVK